MFESFNKPLEVAGVQEVRMALIVENHAIENKKENMALECWNCLGIKGVLFNFFND